MAISTKTLPQQLDEVGLAGVEGVGAVHGDIQETHPLDIHLEDGDICAQSICHAGGIDAGGSSPQHNHAAGQDTGDAAEQDAIAAAMLCQEVAAHDDGHATGDLAHGLEEGEPAIDLDGLVADCGDAICHESGGQGVVRGQVQVSEENAPTLEERVLLRERFLDLYDHLRPTKNLRMIHEQLRPCGSVILIAVA